MKKNISAIILILSICLPSAAFSVQKGKVSKSFNPDKVNARQLVECTPRDGLPNFFDKISAGQKEMTVVYFGGSITDQPGYRVQSLEYLESMYPEVHFTGVNSAIGGTGSSLGALRCGHDVLRHKPDLVFVEFAVNDSGEKPVRIRMQMEGIVRQIWKADPHTDIIFVYTMTHGMLDDYRAGLMYRAASVMEDVADYYGIPSIDMGLEVTRLVDKGVMVMKPQDAQVAVVSGEALDKAADSSELLIFSGDGVHPYPNTGHKIYTGSIKRSWASFDRCLGAREHVLPAPMMPDCIENVTTLSCDDPAMHKSVPLRAAEGFEYMTRMTELYVFEPGAEISFKFRGSEVFMYDVLGPEGAIIDMYIDDEPVRENRRFDPYCGYNRLSSSIVVRTDDTESVHSVRLVVTDRDFDKRSFLNKHALETYSAHPEWFTPKTYYLGKIFVIGEVVE